MNEKPLNREKTTSRVLSELLLIYDLPFKKRIAILSTPPLKQNKTIKNDKLCFLWFKTDISKKNKSK